MPSIVLLSQSRAHKPQELSQVQERETQLPQCQQGGEATEVEKGALRGASERLTDCEDGKNNESRTIVQHS